MKGNEGSGGALQRAQRRLQISFVIRSYCDSTRWISILRHDLANRFPCDTTRRRRKKTGTQVPRDMRRPAGFAGYAGYAGYAGSGS
ncbi:uncharacterized protein N7458_005811 [Penicillium daleae]|uniref:Uncharacterized protein n=1 Tax=Penicillium daleae TaxID=63821 RepID=A0AAD6G564_9EURO|nr:uncharacterized protein N7458_005811 [Penicillium daleae]KAJ5454855.1 hypothetical protein N7458_005811 [Penicillium daleae]